MAVKTRIYHALPDTLQPVAEYGYNAVIGGLTSVYLALHPEKKSDEQHHQQFVDQFFASKQEYRGFVQEFENGDAAEIRDDALEQFQRMAAGENNIGGTIARATARDYYALVRKQQPDTIVETGVSNGLSTLSILLALHMNENGHLCSIDYPLKADESLEEFRQETFNNYGGAAIPSDKEPGWIIPDHLQSRWELIVGRSQRELPLLLSELDSIDMFIHDSEHSHPCMMFEYELSYEWLSDGGILLSDDINWNTAFSTFTTVRSPEHGKLSREVGYIIKSS